ncbi:gfo/Idh/MocA family oxidoreductase, partial [bacterium]
MTGISRRKFLDLAAAAVPSLMILPRRVLGGKGYVAPSDKLNIAGIGVGGMGSGDIRSCGASQNVVALCDADQGAV